MKKWYADRWKNDTDYRGGLRKRWLKGRYGLTLRDYEELADKQSGICAICLGPELKRKYLVVDHDHGTGRVRGLLCHPCNSAIGLLKESITNLERAIRYLKRDDF